MAVMLAVLRRQWKKLPDSFRLRVVRTGLPYAASFMLRYRERHRIANFAGNLQALQASYPGASADARAPLLKQFDSIVDALVMPNAVTKTSYANRLSRSLSAVLSAVPLPGTEIRVLDLPASTGVASLQSLALLRQRYRVISYVLGDKYHRILYDVRRRCIFDEQGNLLQVGFRQYYFSIYRGHVSGDEYTLLSSCLLFPHSVLAWYLRKRYRFEQRSDYLRLLVVHPEVETLLDQNILHLKVMDVFQPIEGRYELILSFNLLQRNYFPPDRITAGVNNLAESLCEGGVLVLGNTEAFLALQKQNGSMIPRVREGTF
jgi:hypothetical protein